MDNNFIEMHCRQPLHRFFSVFILLLSICFPPWSDAAPISDLAAVSPGLNSLTLTWSSPVDAAFYDIRYSNAPITDTTSFNVAVPLGGAPAPKVSGQAESFTINNLACGTKYYFAVMTFGAAKNGTLSNDAGDSTAACLPSFAAPVSVATFNNISPIAVGDFNRDGKADMVVVNRDTNKLMTYLGNGDGTFSKVAAETVVGDYSLRIDVGDFNGDGIPDLAVINFTGQSVSILLGAGDGTFTNSATLPLGAQGHDVSIGDYNRDGKQDLAVTTWGGNNVIIYLGDGSGGFTLKGNYGGLGGTRHLTSVRNADFDSDGILDLVMVDYDNNIVIFLKGNGDGSFQNHVDFGVGTNPHNIAVGDFNGDGKPDIAVANYTSGNISVLLGIGDGTFVAPVNYPVGTNLVPVMALDVTGDGVLDLITGDTAQNKLYLLRGKWDGTFETPVSYSLASVSSFIATGDFNGDGKPDFAVPGSDAAIRIFINTSTWSPAGSFAPGASYDVGTSPVNSTVGDFDGDGKLDVAVPNFKSASVSVLKGNGDGTFQAASNYSTDNGPYFVTTGDFNLDGKTDIISANWYGGNVTTLLNSGNGSFATSTGSVITAINSSVAVGDFNRDGKQDIAVTGIFAGMVYVLPGNGDGTFSSPTSYGVGSNPVQVITDDFNHDGKLDLAVSNTNKVSILLGNGDGTFAAAVDYPVSKGGYLASVDFNRDGNLDIVTNAATGVAVLLGKGDGTFHAAVDYTAGSGRYITTGDFNRDGFMDIAIPDDPNNNISILYGKGDGTFHPPLIVAAAGTFPFAASAADLNRDGKPDLVVTNDLSNAIAILNNTAPLPTVPQQGLVALWRAENNALDSIGGNHGALQGGATYAAGKFGQAFSFSSAANSGVLVPSTPSSNPADALTLSAWIKPSSFSNPWPSIVWRSLNGGDVQYSINVTDQNMFHCDINAGAVFATAGYIPLNEWSHVACSYDRSYLRLYVNGVQVAAVAGTTAIPPSSQPLGIGMLDGFTTRSFDGLIDEAAIHNRALSAAEIRQIASSTPNSFSFAPVTNAQLSTAYESNPVTVTGINVASPVSITGGEYAVSNNGGTTWNAWTASAGTVNLGDQVKVKLTSSASTATAATATLAIGGVSGNYDVTTTTTPVVLALPQNGLVSLWRAENNALDSFGSNHGTLLGGVTFTAGKYGQAFSLDGVDDYVSVPAFGMGVNWTVQGWINPASCSDNKHCTFFSRTNGNPNGDGLLIMYGGPSHPNSTQLLAAFGSGGTWQMMLFSETGLQPGRWYYLALTKSGDTYAFYVNGVLKDQQTVTGVSQIYQQRDISIGKWDYGYNTGNLNGLIDDVAIYNRALTTTEIAALSGTVPGPFTLISQTNMPINSVIQSNPVTVAGTVYPAAISITGGEYAVSTDGGSSWVAWTGLPGTVNAGDQVKVRQTSSGSYSTTTSAPLTIGGVSSAFNVTTSSVGYPSAGLISWWRAEGNAFDAIGGNHGTLQGGALYTAGENGQAFSFDGTTGYVEKTSPDASLNLRNQSWTISAWVKSSFAGANAQMIVSRYECGWLANCNASNPAEYELYLSDSGYAQFEVRGDAGDVNVSDNVDLRNGKWHHIAGVLDRDASEARIIVDGQVRNTIYSVNVGDINDSGSPLEIGRVFRQGWASPHLYFNGLIDEVSIYNRALSESEIKSLYNFNANSLTIAFAGTGRGTVTVNPGGFSGNTGWSMPFHAWDSITLTASPVLDAIFGGWSGGGCSGTGNCSPVVSSDMTVTATFTGIPPSTDFSGTPVSGVEPLVVAFTDLSGHGPLSWLWNFGDNSSGSSAQNPSHVFEDPGGFAVSLTAANGNGSFTATKNAYVNVTACDKQPASLLPVFYESLQAAYDAAAIGDTIRARAKSLTGNLDLGKEKMVHITGGYDCLHTTVVGMTTLAGTLTVKIGAAILENLVIK